MICRRFFSWDNYWFERLPKISITEKHGGIWKTRRCL